MAVASHTRWMRPAARDFLAVLGATAIRRPRVALFCNATGERVNDAESCRQALSAQIATTVQWADCLDAIRSRQPRCVLEVGPGTALAQMWNARHPDIPARSCDEFRSAQAVVAWVDRALA